MEDYNGLQSYQLTTLRDDWNSLITAIDHGRLEQSPIIAIDHRAEDWNSLITAINHGRLEQSLITAINHRAGLEQSLSQLSTTEDWNNL